MTEMQSMLRQIDIVFVIDTTGSMSNFIKEVQKRLQEFSRRLAEDKIHPNVMFGIVAYRDHPPQERSYVTRVFPLADVNITQKNIGSIGADGGGDLPEAVLDGLHDAVEKIAWRMHSHRIILLAGDAPPHGLDEGDDTFPAGCPCGLTIQKVTAGAKKIGAIIHAIGVGEYQGMVRSFTQIAVETGGEFIPLAKVDLLIEKILRLLLLELSKLSTDIDVFDALNTTNDRSTAGLAAVAGKGTGEVAESLNRLREKGALSPEELNTLFGGKIPPAPAGELVDTDLRDEIHLFDAAPGWAPSLPAHEPVDEDLLKEIVFFDEKDDSVSGWDLVIEEDEQLPAEMDDIGPAPTGGVDDSTHE